MISSLSSSSSPFSSTDLAKLFQKADANGDNTLSQDELLNALSGSEGATGTPDSVAKLFDSMDSDGDGALSQNEFSSFAQMFSADSGKALLEAQESANSKDVAQPSLLDTMDSDDDGVVSESEFTAALKAQSGEDQLSEDDISELFATIDTNGDSTISADELKGAMGAMPPPPPPPSAAEDLASAETAEVTASSEESSESAESSEATASSAAAGTEESEDYDPLDTNEDGVVSASERAAGQKDSFGLLNGATLSALMQFNEVAQAA